MSDPAQFRLIFSPLAQRDIDDIWEFTNSSWGPDKAVEYIREIQQKTSLLQANPHIGRKCDDVRVGYRRMPVGTHIVFYRVLNTDVVIVRILHQKMDHPTRL